MHSENFKNPVFFSIAIVALAVARRRAGVATSEHVGSVANIAARAAMRRTKDETVVVVAAASASIARESFSCAAVLRDASMNEHAAFVHRTVVGFAAIVVVMMVISEEAMRFGAVIDAVVTTRR